MPNQRSPKKQSVTVSFDKELVAELDKLAEKEQRSRTQVMEMLLKQQVGAYQKDLSDIANQLPNDLDLQGLVKFLAEAARAEIHADDNSEPPEVPYETDDFATDIEPERNKRARKAAKKRTAK